MSTAPQTSRILGRLGAMGKHLRQWTGHGLLKILAEMIRSALAWESDPRVGACPDCPGRPMQLSQSEVRRHLASRYSCRSLLRGEKACGSDRQPWFRAHLHVRRSGVGEAGVPRHSTEQPLPSCGGPPSCGSLGLRPTLSRSRSPIGIRGFLGPSGKLAAVGQFRSALDA